MSKYVCSYVLGIISMMCILFELFLSAFFDCLFLFECR